jgi:hypothetical protein
MNVYGTVSKNLASLVGDASLLKAVGGCVRSQAPDLAMEVSLGLLIAYLDLLATFIGERLTLRLLQDAWPDVLTSPSPEMKL